MNDKNINPSSLTEGTQNFPNTELQQLLERMDDMQMEIDILKETLKNREKAVI